VTEESEPLPDDALVVRGGKPPFVNNPLDHGCDEHPAGVYGFSVQCAPGKTLGDLAGYLRNRRVGLTTVGEIRRMGYDVVRTAGFGNHATVVVPSDWDGAATEELAWLFQEAENPSPRRTR